MSLLFSASGASSLLATFLFDDLMDILVVSCRSLPWPLDSSAPHTKCYRGRTQCTCSMTARTYKRHVYRRHDALLHNAHDGTRLESVVQHTNGRRAPMHGWHMVTHCTVHINHYGMRLRLRSVAPPTRCVPCSATQYQRWRMACSLKVLCA